MVNRLLNQSLVGVVSFAEYGTGVALRDAAADLPGQMLSLPLSPPHASPKFSDAAVNLTHSLWKSPPQLNRKFHLC